MVTRLPQVGEVWTHTATGNKFEVLIAEPDRHGSRIVRTEGGSYSFGLADDHLYGYTPPRPKEPNDVYVVVNDEGQPTLTIYNERAARGYVDNGGIVAVMKFDRWLD